MNDEDRQTLRLVAEVAKNTLRTIDFDELYGDEIVTVIKMLADTLEALGCDQEFAYAVAYGVAVDVFLHY